LLRSHFVKKFLIVVSFLIPISLLVYLTYKERQILFTYHWHIYWPSIFAAFCMMIFTFIVVVSVWIAQMRAIGSQMPVIVHINNYVATHLARRLPGPFWYIAGRGYLYRQQGESIRAVTVVSSLELLLLTMSGFLFVFLLLLGSKVEWFHQNYWWLWGVLLISASFAHPVTIRWILKRIGKVKAPQISYLQLCSWLLAYLIAWASSGLMFYLLLHALTGLDQQYMLYAIQSWTLVGSLSNLVLFLPSNFGLTELGLSLSMTQILPSSVAVVTALAVRIVVTIFDLIVAGTWFAGLSIKQSLLQRGIDKEQTHK